MNRLGPYVKKGFLIAGVVAACVFAGSEAWKFKSFVDHMVAGAPYVYVHGGPHWGVMACLAPLLFMALFGRRRPETGKKISGAGKAALWLAGLLGLPALILFTPLLLGGGTIITQHLARTYNYEACFWRAGSAGLSSRRAWEVFYVPRGGDCLKLDNYAKERLFNGVDEQKDLPSGAR